MRIQGLSSSILAKHSNRASLHVRAAASSRRPSRRPQSAADSRRRSVARTTGATLALGATTSILLHEAGHITACRSPLGADPTFGFDKLRPTIYSGIDSHTEPHKQFLFSVAGLTVQSLIDEAILDIPHARGSAFERGMLGGGIGTTVFYLTHRPDRLGERRGVHGANARAHEDAGDADLRRRRGDAHYSHLARPALRQLLRAAARWQARRRRDRLGCVSADFLLASVFVRYRSSRMVAKVAAGRAVRRERARGAAPDGRRTEGHSVLRYDRAHRC